MYYTKHNLQDSTSVEYTEESWDSTSVPAYNPTIASLSKPVLRTNFGKTKEEKKSFSFREKKRITSLLEKQIIESKQTNGKHQSQVQKNVNNTYKIFIG